MDEPGVPQIWADVDWLDAAPASARLCGRHTPCLRSSREMRDEAMSIPVVSLEPIIGASANADETVATDLKAALGSWGAFELVEHGVPVATIEGAFAAANTFFRLPVEERMKVRIDRHNRGYAPLHQTVLSRQSAGLERELQCRHAAHRRRSRREGRKAAAWGQS